MTTELAIPDQLRYAEIVTTGDMVPQAYRGKPANALIAIGLGQAMGLSPAESLYRIDVIQGKPTASAELIASNVRKAGHKLRVRVDEQAKSVTATIVRADDPDYEHVVVRDMAWARQMGLDTKDNYKKQPLTMLQWRAISAVARLACSEALYGVSHTADELEDLGERPTAPKPTGLSKLREAADQRDATEVREEYAERTLSGAEAVEFIKTGELASQAQIDALVTALNAAGHTTTKQKADAIEAQLGVRKSSKELTAEEADILVQVFEAQGAADA